MPTAVIISLATGGPPAPPVVTVYTGDSGTEHLRNSTSKSIYNSESEPVRNSRRRTTTRRKSKGCC